MSLQVTKAKIDKNRYLKFRSILKGGLLALFFVLASVVILELKFLTGQVAQLKVNDISPQDIIVSSAISYESQVATERAREQAAQLETVVYSPPDRNVARQQRVAASQIFNFIDAVRVDPYLTQEQKIDYLQALEPISLSDLEADEVLSSNVVKP